MLFYIPMIIIAIAIKIYDKDPVIFRQVRVGHHGKPFICYKFRTMRIDAPQNLSTEEFTNALEYVTPIGAFLRKTSLDEIPQLFNVLAGDMSLIGPRPLIPQEKIIHKMRLEFGVYNVKPGMTGLAQICGRDALTNTRKVECDAIYSNNISFTSDLHVLLITIFKVLLQKDMLESKKTFLDIKYDE